MRFLTLILTCLFTAVCAVDPAPPAAKCATDVVCVLDALAAQPAPPTVQPVVQQQDMSFPRVHLPRDYGVLPASKKDLVYLALMAKYAMAAYDIKKGQILKWTCELCQRPSVKNTRVRYVYSRNSTGLEFYIAVNHKKKAVIVAFAGTDDIYDVFTDIDYPQRRLFRANSTLGLVQDKPLDNWKGIDLRRIFVHRGFLQLYLTGREAMMNKLTKYLQDPKHATYKIHVTGHSLGGALSTLASLDIARTFKERSVIAATFASPRVGDWEFAKLYRNTPNLAQSRYVFVSDMVPRLPPGVFGFVHVGQEFWFPVADGNAVIKCRLMEDYSEDPECTNLLWGTPSLEMHSSVMGYNKPPQTEQGTPAQAAPGTPAQTKQETPAQAKQETPPQTAPGTASQTAAETPAQTKQETPVKA